VLTVDSSGVGIVQRDAELEEASIEGDVDPALAESRRHFFEFWSEFLADWQLDDQRQPLPKASRTTNLYFTMPSGSKSWISAYVAKSKSRVGVYLTFERGPVAETIYAALLGQRAEIEKVVGNELEWEDEGKGKYFILCRKIFPDVSDSRYRAEIIAWLRDISNKFITTFRPRIEAILKESVPAG
jgi:hypothetical protein